MTLSIARAVVCHGLFLVVFSACSLPHFSGNDNAGHLPPFDDSTAAFDIHVPIGEAPAPPEAIAEQREAPSYVSVPPAGSPEAIEETVIVENDPVADKVDAARPEEFALTDGDLIELWREELDMPLPEPSGQRVLSISSDVEEHHRVRYYLEAFRGRLRDFFERALARSGKYRSLMTDILRREGLPEKLVYLALIESGFSPYAYSRAHAHGPWQFIKSTALHYGLTIDSWVDERRDPVLSTRAAAAYLKDLHGKFGEWFLAAAAYNAGEGRVGTALRRSDTNDFWLLRQTRMHLKLETRDYVPKFVAAALIGREPERYGFGEVAYEAPLQYDEVTIFRPVRLQTVARLADTDVEIIRQLNPALLRGFTPPNGDGFTLRLPPESGERFATAYKRLPASAKIKVSLHKVKKGDTLSQIAKRYGVGVSQLMKENGLKSSRIRVGQELVVVRSEAPPRFVNR